MLDGWRIGSNIMRLQDIVGVFKEGDTIIGKSRKESKLLSKESIDLRLPQIL